MKVENFELAFNNYWGEREYIETEKAIYELTRMAFLSGWLAAGGPSPVPRWDELTVLPEKITLE